MIITKKLDNGLMKITLKGLVIYYMRENLKTKGENKIIKFICKKCKKDSYSSSINKLPCPYCGNKDFFIIENKGDEINVLSREIQGFNKNS